MIECQLVWLDYTIEYRIETDYSTTNHNKCISKVLIGFFPTWKCMNDIKDHSSI